MNENVSKFAPGSGAAPSGAVAAGSKVPADVCDLTTTYGAVTAVDRISFTLAAGTTVALLGGNGAGKTTTSATLLGLAVTRSRWVGGLGGADVSRRRGRVRDRMNSQSPSVDLPARLTVKETLTVYAGLYGIANATERIAFIAQGLQTAPLLDRATSKLSAGQKTRGGL